jgi:hypothetical protein
MFFSNFFFAEQSGELQLSEVSSSRPNIIPTDVQCPILFEALDGFLILVGLDGKIEFVSENVGTLLNHNGVSPLAWSTLKTDIDC